MNLTGFLIGGLFGSIAYVGALLVLKHKRKKEDKETEKELEGEEDVE